MTQRALGPHILLLYFLVSILAAAFASPVGADVETEPLEKPKLEKDQDQNEKPDNADELYELMKLFADTMDEVEQNYVRPISRRELMEAAIQGVLSKLDNYSDYIAPDDVEDFRREVESEFGGIGIQVGIENGNLVVISPLVGTPAYRAGIAAGDIIMEIDGRKIKGLPIGESVKLMKGKLGTKVLLKIRSTDDETRELPVERDVIRIETVLGHHRKDNDEWEYIFDEQQKLAYIRLNAFSRHTSEDLRAALNKIVEQNILGLILDLRFNPGGLLESAIEVSDMFLTEGRIVSTAGRNVRERVWEASAEGTFEDFKMVVLVNRYSASASEIVAACLQDNNRAVVVGERTWGKGSVQRVIELEGGRSALKLTTASYQRPNGENIHRFPNMTDADEWGVMPNEGLEVRLRDFEIRQLWRDQRERNLPKTDRNTATAARESDQKDRQMRKAIEQLGVLLAQ